MVSDGDDEYYENKDDECYETGSLLGSEVHYTTESDKDARYNVNTQKSLAFLYPFNMKDQ